MILLLHNRYRTLGGEERVVEDLRWLLNERMGEEVELLGSDSALLGRPRAAVALLRGGLAPDDVAVAVRRTGARIVHGHNVSPAFGARGLAAARGAGARIVLHLHNYRLVCSVATCFTRGEDCTRCHATNTLPGVRLACRGSRAESAVYAASIALWQRRLCEQVDVFVTPSDFARERLLALGAPLDDRIRVVPHFVKRFASESAAGSGRGVVLVSRLAPEKGVDLAIEACERAGLPLTVVGDGPQAPSLRARAGPGVTFTGRLEGDELDVLRRGAALALSTARAGETFGLAAVEAMAAGLPVVANDCGALGELVPEEGLVAAGDVVAMATRIQALYGDAAAGERAIARARKVASPEGTCEALRDAYESAVTGVR